MRRRSASRSSLFLWARTGIGTIAAGHGTDAATIGSIASRCMQDPRDRRREPRYRRDFMRVVFLKTATIATTVTTAATTVIGTATAIVPATIVATTVIA